MVSEKEIKNCKKKVSYDTKNKARNAAGKASRRFQINKLYPYHCKICGKYHLTSQKPEVTKWWRRYKGFYE